MTTRATLRVDLQNRINDPSAVVFSTTELNYFIDQAIQSLYPTWFSLETGSTTAGAGPIQTAPTGASDVYYIGVRTPTSNRVRVMRGWQEGNGNAIIPKVGIDGYTLVWAWTASYAKPSTDGDTLTIPAELEEVVMIRAQITCLEQILQERSRKSQYLAVNVREGVTEQEIAITLNALHDSFDERAAKAIPRPERVG